MGSKASCWMSCFENTASQGNLNDRGLVRPDRSEDEPSGAKSFLVLHIQACWAEMGACSISVTGTRYEDVEARPWASWKATERTAQHTPRTTGSDSFLFCFVLFCFVLFCCHSAGSQDLGSPTRDQMRATAMRALNPVWTTLEFPKCF